MNSSDGYSYYKHYYYNDQGPGVDIWRQGISGTYEYKTFWDQWVRKSASLVPLTLVRISYDEFLLESIK